MTGAGYYGPRPPLPPFFLNPSDPASIIMRERAALFSHLQATGQIPSGIPAPGLPRHHPMMPSFGSPSLPSPSSPSSSHPGFSPSQQFSNFLAASAAFASNPWYLAALAADASRNSSGNGSLSNGMGSFPSPSSFPSSLVSPTSTTGTQPPTSGLPMRLSSPASSPVLPNMPSTSSAGLSGHWSPASVASSSNGN